MLLKPYETTSGKLINTLAIQKSILEYITANDDAVNLGYEFTNAEYKLIVITGKNDTEKSIPGFILPLYFKDIKNVECVAIDVRPYLTSVYNKDISNILDYARDKHAINFLVLTTVLYYKQANDLMGLKPIVGYGLNAFFSVIVAAINKITMLSPMDKLSIETAAGVYAYSLFTTQDIRDDRERLIAYLGRAKYSFPVDRKNLVTNIDLALGGYDPSVTGLTSLGNILKNVLPNDLQELANVNGVCAILENSWWGPGGNTTVYASLESLPLFMAMVYSLLSNPAYKNSKLGTIIEYAKKRAGLDNYKKYIDQTLVSDTIGRLL